MSLLPKLFLLLRQPLSNMGEKYPPDHQNNFSDTTNSFVVGIPLTQSTVYVDNPSDNRNSVPLYDSNSRKRSNTSFQITSVTVQGSRTGNDDLEDSADDYDDSHTDDISSDILDSSKITDADGYQSEEAATFEDLSPCGPMIITPLTSPMDSNMNVGLGINMSPPFPAVSSKMMTDGVTMITSNAESPVSSQVPKMKPLPDNWQHRFRVVKIVSSEPFRRGRWLCTDFRDPPQPPDKSKSDLKLSIPSIQVTPCSSDNIPLPENNNIAHVIEIPVSTTNNAPTNERDQPIYGILVPRENNHTPTNTPQHSGRFIVSRVQDDNANRMPANSNHQQAPVRASNVSFIPQIDYENRINNNVAATNYQNLNGHYPTAYTNRIPRDEPPSPDAVPYVVPVPPDKQQHMAQNQVECIESSFCTLESELRRTSGLSIRPKSRTNGIKVSKMPNVILSGKSVAIARVPSIAPAAPSATPLPPTTPPVPVATCEVPSSTAPSGASTVAIDNKIEQAMDLVKSHLMFAVREEVEVLKEKITELLERISQLEHENDILRANASPETLKQLNQSQKFTAHPMIGKQHPLPSHIQNQPPAS